MRRARRGGEFRRRGRGGAPAGRAAEGRLESYLDEERRSMRLAVVNDDMPFLVDSISSAIAAHDIAVHRIIHPVIAVRAREERQARLDRPRCRQARAANR
jgi:NAD-specific glutamate dehydrogenase